MIQFRQYILRWPLYMTAVFCVYALILLWNIFSTQSQLRSTIDARLVADCQRRGAAIADFTNARRKKVTELAVSQEIEAYLANKALGMSEQYGLFANLTAIEERFHHEIKEDVYRDSPIYRQVIYFDEKGAPLTETVADSPLRVPENSQNGIRLIIDEVNKTIVASAPVFHKERFSGTVVTAGDLDQFSRLLIADLNGEGGQRYLELLVSDEGLSLTSPENSTSLNRPFAQQLAHLQENVITPLLAYPGSPPGLTKSLALRTMVQGTPLSYVILIDPDLAYGQLSSRIYLYTFSIFPFLLLFGMIVLERQRRSAEKLQNDNTALASEISRRTVLEQELREKTESLEQLAIEFQLIASRAEDASNAKSQFLANMSHEIRTPMNAILGMSYLALQSNLTAKQREQITYLHNAAESLLGIINDILDFSKVEAGKMNLEQTPFVLKDILDEIILLFKPKMVEKRLEFHYDEQDQVVANKAPLLIGDELRLKQVLTNLLSNAVKFTEKGFVRFGVSSFNAESTIRVIFTVQDSGIGMNCEQKSRLFEEFSQADASTTRQYGGTGLGMAIAWRLVELMDGTINVESQLGQGSCFTVEIPFEVALVGGTPLKERRNKTRNYDALRGTRVLLVEDNSINRLLAVELLAMKGLLTDIAENGEDALEKLRSLPPDTFKTVLMDLQMPVLDGYETTRIIRSDPKFDALPIIALSAHVLSSEKERCRKLGMNGYINKPFDPEHLWHALLRSTRKNESLPVASVQQLWLKSEQIDPEIDITGVNFSEGIQRAGGDHNLYMKVVGEILKNFASGYEELLGRANQKDSNSGQAYAHELRGVFGAIGAHEMQDALAAIEESFRVGADPRSQIQELEKPYIALMEVLNEYLNSNWPQKPENEMFKACSVDVTWLETFADYLGKGDFEAVELWENNKAMLEGRFSPAELGEISRALQQFDFAYALECLNTRAQR